MCSSCDPESEYPELYKDKETKRKTCIKQCPVGYTSVNNECVECESPCQQCKGSATTCTACNGVDDIRYLFAGTCYAECPVNTSPSNENEQNLVCIGCVDPACELCDSADPSICKRCTTGLYVYDGKCKSGCPDGWKTNNDGTACVLFTINDIGIIPFPFLILAFICCLIAFFGRCKKKLAGRNNKYISSQKTLTCFIVILATI